MWWNIVDLDGPQMTIWRIHIACWINKATNTLLEYFMIAYTARIVARTGPNVTLYIPCLSCCSLNSSLSVRTLTIMSQLFFAQNNILLCILFCTYRQLARWNVARQVDCRDSRWIAVSPVWTHTTSDRQWLWYLDFSVGKEWTVSLHGQVVMRESSTSVMRVLVLTCNVSLFSLPSNWSHQILPHVTGHVKVLQGRR